MNDKVFSPVTRRFYEPAKMVRIVNLTQIDKYLKHGATVYDVYISHNMVVFIFDRKETQPLYDLWCNHELD